MKEAGQWQKKFTCSLEALRTLGSEIERSKTYGAFIANVEKLHQTRSTFNSVNANALEKSRNLFAAIEKYHLDACKCKFCVIKHNRVEYSQSFYRLAVETC